MRRPYAVRDYFKPRDGPKARCTHCGRPATKEALFRTQGVTTVEKYCDACMEPEIFQDIMEFYASTTS